MQNLEIKAQYHDLKFAADIAAAIGARFKWRQWQRDTYFQVPQGKLKLREVEGEPAELIAYQRPQKDEAKISDYLIYKTGDSAVLKQVLEKCLHLQIAVNKERTLYLWQNVRIHLDRVKDLGSFIEFEAVLNDSEDSNLSRDRLQFLQAKFAIRNEDLISVGYHELLMQRPRQLKGEMN